METAGIPDLAGKLQRLFNSIPRTDGQGWYTNEAMTRELAERGVPVTVQHLSSLRTGRRDNPSARLLAAIADVFGVPLSYFFDEQEERQVAKDLETLARLRRVGGLRLRGEIDAEGVLQLIAALKQIESLEAVDDESD